MIAATSSNLAELGEVRAAKELNGEFILSKPGRVTFRTPIDDPVMAALEPVKHCILLALDDIVFWSGPLWVMSDSNPQRMLNITAVGWLELLYHRVFRTKQVYSSEYRGNIIHFLLALANSYQTTWMAPGTQGDAAPQITKTFEKDSNIGQGVEEMTQIEAGPDIFVDPLTRNLNVQQWNLYADLPGVVFTYGIGPSNLSSFVRTVDADQMINRLSVYGKNSNLVPALAEDTTSQADFQLFESTTTLSDVSDASVLLAYAGVEVAMFGLPRTTYTLSPNLKAPLLFRDFKLGDKVYLKAKGGRVDVDQAVRVFSATLGRDDEGNVRMNSLATVAA